MPHSPEEKKRTVTRLRRIRGQTEALERAVMAGTECGVLLQQLAALRGAATGLMAEVLESHLRETFGGAARHTVATGGGHASATARNAQAAEAANEADKTDAADAAQEAEAATTAEIDQLMRIIRSYLK
jgi:DNA-binding FrmR family transcriptional regulator